MHLPSASCIFLLLALVTGQLPAQIRGVRQFPPPPSPPANAPVLPEAANPFWEHPGGDNQTVPCVHLQPQHPGGDLAPCACPPVLQHPGGDDATVPCVHRTQQHPGGDDTGRKGPCMHPTRTGPQHPGGDPIMVPCVHFTTQHPNGDTTKVPCTHVSRKHPNGEPGTNVPCAHLAPQHPRGDTVKSPCAHPLPMVRRNANPPVDFYTSDAQVQADILAALQKLAGLGVRYNWPRPLNVFHREPVHGNPDDNNDPFWSHYDPVQNALVVTKDPASYQAPNPLPAGMTLSTWRSERARTLSHTVAHEIGHALLGNKCVQIATPAGAHSYLGDADEGLAMSEGWGNFVSLVIECDRNGASAVHLVPPNANGFDMEAAQSETRASFTEKSEFRVTAVLWDLFDTHNEAGDPASIPFQDMFAVFSPSLQTLTTGPVFKKLTSYCERLVKNGSKQSDIDAVLRLNLSRR